MLTLLGVLVALIGGERARGNPEPHAAQAQATEAPRVRAARARSEANIQRLFERAHLASPARELLLRGFKREGQLELWGRSSADPATPLTLITTYAICARSGGPGPKRRAGDGQVPEGFYEVSGLNPQSNFLLSLRVSYPNKSDRALGAKGDLGGDIFIHGDCVTIGCLPIQDGPIQELYVIVQDAKAAGARVQVHLFPQRLTDAGLAQLGAAAPALLPFWENLREGDRRFEEHHLAPRVTVAPDGKYRFE